MLDSECDHQFVVFLSLESDKGTVFIWMETGYLSYLEIFHFCTMQEHNSVHNSVCFTSWCSEYVQGLGSGLLHQLSRSFEALLR